MREKIRIGVILRETIVEQWVFKILKRLHKADSTSIVLILKPGTKHPAVEKKASPVFRFHQHLDSWLYRGRYDYNLLIDCSDLIRSVPVISFEEEESLINHTDELQATFHLDGNMPDILLNLSQDKVPRQVFKLAKCGILNFKVEGQISHGNLLAAYYSLITHKPEIECFVTLDMDGKDENVLCKSSVSTLSNSININLNRVLGLAELLIPRVIEWLYLKDERIMKKIRGEAPINFSAPLADINIPSSTESLRNLIQIQINSLQKKALYLKDESWRLHYRNSNQFEPLTGRYDDFKRLMAPKGYYWADPFVVKDQGKYYLFVEEYSYETSRGHLAVLRPDQDGKYRHSEVILKKPYHLSYPFVFIYDGEYYLIPETKAEKVIQIYRSKNFPLNWEFVTNIMTGVAAADSTVFYYNDKWWLFTSIDMLNNVDISFGELFLFYTDNLFSGKWHSHPQNPIITDISYSRPAGKIFWHNGILIRPSQDCAGGYGKAINLNKIKKITETEYEEEKLIRIAPDWDSKLVGMHTFNSVDSFYVFDTNSQRKRFGN